ncbi:RNA polymerase sigma factor [Candidatus Parcubacteria bacterium]|nr:RNA polymerase sigma factor [Candidatus Parcubacteria bacterium]
MSSSTDAEVVAAVVQGDTNAFATLVQRYQQRLYNYLFRFTHHKEDCEDLVEETFAAAFQKLQTCRTPERFASWLFAIAHNFGVNQWRKRKRASNFTQELDEVVAATVPDKGLSPHELSVRQEDARRLELALQQLSPKYRSVLLLYYYEDLAYQEISATLGISLDLVKTHLFRAKRALLKELETEASGKRGFGGGKLNAPVLLAVRLNPASPWK